ncbi:hypothetical protein BDFB_004818 [Asbolus verrucosus]|uniref:Uncharacterized protein n=1 Tax=Asbolus verrucosus TaxID=1661398 RepID=A0A482WCZ7_ASBVE|nr:hypothetical protein BDFB_004818 [Asbolus verrucosus]
MGESRRPNDLKFAYESGDAQFKNKRNA